MYNIEFAIEHGEPCVRRVQDITCDELRTEGLFVLEELIPQLDKLRTQVGSGKVGGWSAVEGYLPEDVAEATAQVEQPVPSFKSRNDVRVLWCGSEVEI
jgi:hypothetical protein